MLACDGAIVTQSAVVAPAGIANYILAIAGLAGYIDVMAVACDIPDIHDSRTSVQQLLIKGIH